VKPGAARLAGRPGVGHGTLGAAAFRHRPPLRYPAGMQGFTHRTIATAGAEIAVWTAGQGPPLLLLHGYPQTHVMWHRIAPQLAERFTVVAPDLRGYGASAKPPTDDRHAPYAKRAMAQDMAEVMTALGFARFRVIGHDRGGRVGHRLALDHAERVAHLSVLDIAPTLEMYRRADETFARHYYHWFFLIQPYDLPERLIGYDPDYYLEKKMGAWSRVAGCFDPQAAEAYKRAFRDPATIHATCEDYRAAATIDLEHDEADLDRKLACPVLCLWGARGAVGQMYGDVTRIWRERAREVRGQALDCGHFLPEEAPEATLAAVEAEYARLDA
jgi:haloacetate dehalogenase